MDRNARGFTLIELLVVIAIIGILSSVVLASLSAARERGRDAAIQAQMAQMRSQAALFYAEHGTYLPGAGTGGGDDSFGECIISTDPAYLARFEGSVLREDFDHNLASLITSVYANSRTAGTRIKCAVYADSWALAAPLHQPASGTTGWCVDSEGSAQAVNFNFEAMGVELSNSGSAYCP